MAIVLPTRRNMLRGAAGAGLALPFSGLLRSNAGHAATGSAPKRLLVLDLPNAVWRSDWLPTGGRMVDQGTGDATQFQYGPQSAWFEKIRKYTTFIEGLPVLRPTGSDSHVGAQVQFMTGSCIPAGGDEMSKYPSIDQLLAKKSPIFAGAGAAQSVTWCAHTQGDGVRPHIHIIAFDDAPTPQPIFPQNSPLLAYNSIFAGFVPGNTSTEQQAQLAVALKQNKSVLDYVKGSVERMSARAPAAEKVRLETHMQGLRELEMRLTQMPGGGSGFAQVSLPMQSSLQDLVVNDTAHHKGVVDGFLGLTKAAFGFDRTRVATLMLASGHNWVILKDYVPQLTQSGRVHEITHLSYVNKNLDMRLITNWYGDILNNFVLDLAATPDIDGTSMLDNILIVFFSEVSIIGDGIDAVHDPKNTPLAMIGGSALGHIGGRYLRYENHTTNDFWTTVGRRLGLGDQFVMGNAADNRSALPELFPA